MTIPYCINSIWAKAPKAIVSGKRVKSGLETREVEVIKPQICKKQMSGNLSTKSCPCMICCGAWWTCSNLEFGKRVPCEFQFKSNKSWIAMFFFGQKVTILALLMLAEHSKSSIYDPWLWLPKTSLVLVPHAFPVPSKVMVRFFVKSTRTIIPHHPKDMI